MTRFILVLSLFTGSASPVLAGPIFGFVDVGGAFTTFNEPKALQFLQPTYAQGINNADQIVGYTFERSFLYVGGIFTTISDPLGLTTYAQGINNAGQIVGYYNAGMGNHGFLDAAGTFTTIDDPLTTAISGPDVLRGTEVLGINDAGQIVGFYYLGDGVEQGFLDVGGIFTTIDDPLATHGTFARGINDAGQIVGYYYDATGSHGFLNAGGTFTTIDDPLATGGTWAQGINAAGQIVGYYTDAMGGSHGFLDAGGTFTTIDGGPPFGSETWLTGINDSSDITGQMITPEPSTLAMIFAALLGMAGWLKRKLLKSTP